MKVLILYRPNSEYARQVEEFMREFNKRYPDKHLDVLDIDTREGAALASLYDVMTKPAVLALQDNGEVVQSWTDQMPLLNEIAYYTHL